MTLREYRVWLEYSKHEPWGFPIEDFRSAMQATVTANWSGNCRKPMNLSDFAYRPPEPAPEELTPEEVEAQLMRVLR